jgi:hypothetical protein
MRDATREPFGPRSTRPFFSANCAAAPRGSNATAPSTRLHAMAMRMMLSFFMTYGTVRRLMDSAASLVASSRRKSGYPEGRLAPLPSGDAGGSGPAGNLILCD